MALLFMEGFDTIGPSVTIVTHGKWASGGSTSTNGSQFRTGICSAAISTTAGELISKTFTVSGGFCVGLALQIPSLAAGTTNIIEAREGTTVHLALGITAANLLTVKRGTTVLATGTTVIPISGWVYIEFKGVIDDTTGSYEVRIDGVSEAALTTAGPVDTRNVGTTGQWDRIRLTGIVGGVTYIDDLYICDLTGSAPRNTFLGMVKIETLMPQTDATAVGSNAGLTPSTGTDHGALVDETTPNTTDYNGSATVGVKDTYNYPAMTLTGTVLGIQTNLYCAKSDAAARTVCPVIRTASVDNDGTSFTPNTTYAYSTQIWPQDPNAGSPIEWTTANIATMQAGMKVTA